MATGAAGAGFGARAAYSTVRLRAAFAFALWHAPGHMLVTDLPNRQYRVP